MPNNNLAGEYFADRSAQEAPFEANKHESVMKRLARTVQLIGLTEP